LRGHEVVDVPSPTSFTKEACVKRALRLGPKSFEPLISLTIGGDDESQGVVVWANIPSGSRYQHVECLMGVRWSHRYTAVDDMLRIAIEALQKLREQGAGV
jgi:hypothetical protein